MLLLSLAMAQVSPEASFVGESSEGFEFFAQTGDPLPCLDGVFGGTGSVCALDAAVGGMQVRDSLFLGCLLEPTGGSRLASSNDGAATFVFDTTVTRFGGQFATHANDGDLVFEAFGADGRPLGTHVVPFGGSCNWAWQGLSSPVPIASVRVSHSDHGGALADYDDLQVDTSCGPGAPDADGDGVPACVDCDDNDATRFPGAWDDCDGVDDDCNGIVDDAPIGAGLSSLQDGVCAGTTLVCGPNGLVDPDFSSIDGYEATETSCDGIDNDCNGIVDDGEAPPLSEFGVCAGVSQECGPNGWEAPDPSTIPGYQEVEVFCDGLDNDCDGEVDEGQRPVPYDTGACADLLMTCVDGDWVEPELPPAFGPEICNGIDDDCNGEVDDDCVEPAACGCRSSQARWPAFLRRR